MFFNIMDDNVRPHQGNFYDEFLEYKDIEQIPFPAKWFLLILTQSGANLWDYLRKADPRRHPHPIYVNDLIIAFLEVIVNNKIISNMKMHCDMCI